MYVPRIVTNIEGRPVDISKRWLVMRPSLTHEWALWAISGIYADGGEPPDAIMDILHQGTEEECLYYMNVIEKFSVLDGIDIARRCGIPSTKCGCLIH